MYIADIESLSPLPASNFEKGIENIGRGICLGKFHNYEKKSSFAQKVYVPGRVYIRFIQAVKDVVFHTPLNPTDTFS